MALLHLLHLYCYLEQLNWVNANLFDKGFHFMGIGDAEYNEAKGEFILTTRDQIDAYLNAADEAGIDTTDARAAIEAKE